MRSHVLNMDEHSGRRTDCSSRTVYFEGIDGLELSGGHFTEDGEHVHKLIEAEVPHPVL